MQKFKKNFKWILGIVFIIVGISSLFTDVLTGLTFLLLGILIIPPTFKLLEEKFNVIVPRWSKYLGAFGVLIIASFFISNAMAKKEAKAELLYKEAVGFINKGQYDSATVYLTDAKELYSSSENKAQDLLLDIKLSESQDFAKQSVALLTADEFKELHDGTLEKEYIKSAKLNERLLDFMRSQGKDQTIIKQEIEEKRQLAEAEEERKKQLELQKNKEKLIENQFSSWDGSHRNLERFIKDNMNDPDSYDHIETRYRDEGNSLVVITKFRGANAFGGKVINTITARVDLEGNVLEIISQN